MSQINQAALDNIRALQRPGSPDLLGRIITLFLNQTPDVVKTLLMAIESGDLDAARTNAHSLKSSAAYVGAVAYSEKLAEIERAAKEEHLVLCNELTIDLDKDTSEVMNELMVLQEQAA